MTPILLDTIVTIVILLSIAVAFFRGFIKEMLTIVNLAGATAAGYFLGPLLTPFFKNWLGVTDQIQQKADYIWGVVPPQVMAAFLAYGTAFFGVFIVLSLAGMAISSSAKALGLGPFDRLLGMVFGAVRGFLLVFLCYLPFGFFMQPEQLPDWAKSSISVMVLDSSYKWADAYLKEEDAGSGAKTAEDPPADPDSLKGRLKKMADDMMPRQDGTAEKQDQEQPAAAEEKDILTDDEAR